MINAELLGYYQYYDKGFLHDYDGNVVGKVKNRLYINAVEALLITVNDIYDQDRPIMDDSFEVMIQSLDLIRSMIVTIQ